MSYFDIFLWLLSIVIAVGCLFNKKLHNKAACFLWWALFPWVFPRYAKKKEIIKHQWKSWLLVLVSPIFYVPLLLLFLIIILFSSERNGREYRIPGNVDEVMEMDDIIVPIDISLEESLELKKKIDSQGSNVVVHNALEFLMAIGDNRTITIDSKDTIYLSPAILALAENGFCEEAGIVGLGGDFEDRGNEGILFYYNYDGIGVAICGISNLTITSKKNAIVASHPRYDDVLKFVRCENVKLSNLVLSHVNQGECWDGVVSLIKSNSISLKNCDLYGCGTEGIIISDSYDIDCNKVKIRDCSYHIMHIEQSNNVHFTDCSFYNNREYEQINIDGSCDEIIFDKCIIKDNQGPLFNVDSDVLMRNCTISHDNELGSIEHVKFENTFINK